MADTAAKTTATTDETPVKGKPGRKKIERDPNGRQIGAFFDKKDADLIREAKFVLRLDKESDVIKRAVSDLIAQHGISL